MKTTKNLWRVITLALALVMLFSVVACGNNEDPAATTEAGADSTAAPTTQAPTTEKPTTQAPTTEKPTTAPTTEPTTEGTTAGTDEPVTPPEDLSQPDVWDGTNDTSWFDINNIQAEYVLTTAEQFAGFIKLRQDGYNKVLQADRYYFDGVSIKLARDIILNEGTAEEIKALAALGQAKQLTALNSKAGFQGTFDGQGHTISGVFLDCTTSGVKAFFGALGENGVAKNLNVKSGYFNAAEADKHTGAIFVSAIRGNALISNVTVTDALLEESTNLFSGVGILVGTVAAGNKLTIENCHTEGIINFPTQGTNNYAFGGIVGYLESGAAETVDEATGAVTAPATTTTLIMKNCTSSAQITGTNIIGGLLGKVMDRYELSMDYKCKFTGTINATTPAEGGEIWTGEYVPGIEGFKPEQPTVVEDFTADDFSAIKYPEFENAIVIEGANCETNSTVIEKKATQFHLYNIDGKPGAAAHGVTKLDQSGVFHYYIDLGNVNKTIEAETGDASKKIAVLDDCYIRWTFTITEAGTYTVGSYMRLKDASKRACMVQFDDQTPIVMNYTLTDEDLAGIKDETHGSYLMWDGVEVTLEAGEHTLTYNFPPEDIRVSGSSWHWRTIYLMKKAA